MYEFEHKPLSLRVRRYVGQVVWAGGGFPVATKKQSRFWISMLLYVTCSNLCIWEIAQFNLLLWNERRLPLGQFSNILTHFKKQISSSMYNYCQIDQIPACCHSEMVVYAHTTTRFIPRSSESEYGRRKRNDFKLKISTVFVIKLQRPVGTHRSGNRTHHTPFFRKHSHFFYYSSASRHQRKIQ